MANVRSDAHDNDDKRNQPTQELRQADPIDPALKANFQVDREDWFLDWRLNHFGLPFVIKKGAKMRGRAGHPTTQSLSKT